MLQYHVLAFYGYESGTADAIPSNAWSRPVDTEFVQLCWVCIRRTYAGNANGNGETNKIKRVRLNGTNAHAMHCMPRMSIPRQTSAARRDATTKSWCMCIVQ